MKAKSFLKKKEFNAHRLARRDYYLEHKPRTRFIFYIIFFLIIILSSLYFLIFSPHCQVNKIDITIDDDINLRYANEEVSDYVKSLAAEKYLFFIPAKSLIIFPARKINERLKEDQRIESFSVEKIAPDILKVNLKIFKPEAVLIDKLGNFYLLNKGGQLIEPIKENTSSLPTINDQTGRNQEQELSRIINFINDVNSNFEFKIERVEIYRDQGVVVTKAITSENWEILLDNQEDLAKQTASLFLALREKIKDRKDLSYIDLRFEDRIFYK
jgi:hypothetical protein